MTFSLPPNLTSFVESSVAAGKFASPEAMIAAGLELLRERQEYDEYVRRELQVGIDELERGEGIAFENMNELAAYIRDMVRDSRERVESKRNSA